MRLTEDIIEKLYKEYDTPPWVIDHCKEVARVGAEIAAALNEKGGNFDVELVRVSGLVHDVLRKVENHDVEIGKLLMSMGYTEESDVVSRHMRYYFNSPENINETDIMCLADRIVKENHYVGIDERVEYLIHKPDETPERTERLLNAKAESKKFIAIIEEKMGRTIDSLFFQSGEMVERKLEHILKLVEKPARYIGGEKGIVIKDPKDKLRFAFGFPDIYEIGMSYMGLEILYNLVNKKDDLYLERVFHPAEDMARIMREEKLPLFTLETKTPVYEMDVIGFTLQYEMSFTNILDMLDLAGLPLMTKDRTEEHPIVIAGGPCAFNPEPLTDFIDIFLIGDGEILLPNVLEIIKEAKDRGLSRSELYQKLNGMTGVYIPALYKIEYNEDGTIREFIGPEGEFKPVMRYILPDIEDIDFPENPIVPFIETVHDRAVVEAFRGCTRGCRFCQAGMIYRPIRERSEDRILNLADSQINYTGHDELSLLSLSSSDYSKFESLALTLTERCANFNVALSLPSLRLDTFSFKVLQEIQKYRKSGLTFAPEAGTQRLRDVINKGITDKDIYDAVSQAMDLGWTRIKLYFMIGLPTETFEDLDGIAEIARNIIHIKRQKEKHRFTVTISVSNFVPKAHTPFQWASQDTAAMFREKHNYLREILKIKGVTFNYHDDDTSVLEAIIARGDRRTGALIKRAYEKGCSRDSWSEHFKRELWDEAMNETGVLPEFYAFRKRELYEIMPWDIINSGISKSFLKNEWNKAVSEEVTRDCRYGCTGCGINRYTECKFGGIYKEND